MRSFSFFFCELCYEAGHLTLDSLCWHRTHFRSWTSSVFRTCTIRLGIESPVTAREKDITALDASEAVLILIFIRYKYRIVPDTGKSRSQPVKLERRGQRTSALNQLTRPKTVLQAQMPLLPIPLELESSCDERTDILGRTLWKNATLFLAIMATWTDKGRNDSTNTVNSAQPASCSTVDTNVAIKARPTY